jgi:CheY-like chemotaxis protein
LSEKVKIIIVDDEPDMQIYLSTLLAEHGFDPIVANTEAEAFEKARSLHPACIILNAMMSTDGHRPMYVNLKCDEQLKTVPVIMRSPVARKILFQYRKIKAHPNGGYLPEPEAFFENPLNAEELLAELHRLAGK